MKTIEQLEQEAKQARDNAIEVLNLETFNKALFVKRIIEASVAMVTYQLALGMQEVSGDGSGEALPEVSQEDTEVIALMKEALKEIERNTCSHEETHRGGAIWEICDICGCKWADDEGGKPEFVELKIVTDLRNYIEKSKVISQEERDSDGWIEWNGGYCPVNDESQLLEVKYRSTQIYNRVAAAWRHRWHHADRSLVIDGSPELDIIAYRIVK